MFNWKVNWDVEFDGKSIADAIRPYLISISVTDKAGDTSDSCSLKLDDTDGRLKWPQTGGKVRVLLNSVQVFSGILEVPLSTGSRGGGRTISVSAKGFDTAGKAKEVQALHQDDGTVGDFLRKLGQKAGFSFEADPELGNIFRDYLVADHESFLHAGQRLARELGGTFKLRDGNRAVLVKKGADNGLPSVSCRFSGSNPNGMIWSISPVSGRSTYKKVKVRYFDREAADFKEEEVEVEQDAKAPDTINRVRTAGADKGHAKNIAEGRKAEIKREGGEGSVAMDVTPEAQAEGLCIVSGARPGIDGTYRITSVNHKVDRSGGSTTSLQLKQPSGDAGKDSR